MTAATKDRLIFFGWWMVFVAFMSMLVAYGARFYSFGIYLKPMSQEMGWSRATTSSAFTISSLFLGFLSPFVGKILDKYGNKVIMFWGAAIAGLGFALCYFTQSLFHFYIFFSLIMPIGIAGTGMVPSNALVAKWFKKKSGFALGIVSVGMGLGSFVMVNLAEYLISMYGWRTSFLVMGVIIWVVICPMALFLVRNKPSDMGLLPDGDDPSTAPAPAATPGKGPAAPAGDVWPMKEFLRTPAFWGIALMFATVCFGSLINLVHLVPHATDIGHSRKFAAFLLSIMMLSSLCGRFIIGYIADKVNPVKLMAFLLTWSFLAMFFFMNITGIKDPAMFYAYVIIFGFPYGPIAQLTATIINKTFGQASFGAIFGAVFFAGTFGTGFGPLFAGWIYDVTKNYDIAFVVAASLFLVSAILLLLLASKPPKRMKAKA